MPSKKRATPISLQPLDALFGTNEESINGISEIAIGSLHPFPNHPFQVRRIVEWQPGHLLLASDEGLTKYDVTTEKVDVIKADSRHPEGLNDNYLHELFLDRENALWIGTYFGGVNYVSSVQDNFRHYHKDNSQLDARIISVFAHADKGNLFLQIHP